MFMFSEASVGGISYQKRFKVTGIRPVACPKYMSTQRFMTINIKVMEIICFEIIHGLLISVFDQVSKPKFSGFTAQYSSCHLQNDIF